MGRGAFSYHITLLFNLLPHLKMSIQKLEMLIEVLSSYSKKDRKKELDFKPIKTKRSLISFKIGNI